MFARYKAFIWRDGDIQPVEHPDRIDMDTFTGYERQRSQVVNNISIIRLFVVGVVSV